MLFFFGNVNIKTRFFQCKKTLSYDNCYGCRMQLAQPWQVVAGSFVESSIWSTTHTRRGGRPPPAHREIDVSHDNWPNIEATQAVGGFLGQKILSAWLSYHLPLQHNKNLWSLLIANLKVGFKCSKMFSEHQPSQISDRQSLILQQETLWERSSSVFPSCEVVHRNC